MWARVEAYRNIHKYLKNIDKCGYTSKKAQKYTNIYWEHAKTYSNVHEQNKLSNQYVQTCVIMQNNKKMWAKMCESIKIQNKYFI